MLYDIDGENSIKALHEHPGKEYSVTPGAATIDSQRKSNPKKDVVNDDSS